MVARWGEEPGLRLDTCAATWRACMSFSKLVANEASLGQRFEDLAISPNDVVRDQAKITAAGASRIHRGCGSERVALAIRV